MRLSDFDYPLDESLIAQHPIEPRDQARLLVVDRATGGIRHQHVHDLPRLLRAGDLMVFNNTRVIPARLLGRKRPSGGKIELLLVRPVPAAAQATWEALIKGHVRPGQELELPDQVHATVLESRDGKHTVVFPLNLDVLAYAEKAGLVPLPPYIRRAPLEADRQRYQTIFARHPGAVAAPTAGLHFTEELLRGLKAEGIGTTMVTLHVGPGTFKPVTAEDIRAHAMDAEWYDLPAETARRVSEVRAAGARVIAVGSTSLRVLETAAAKGLPLSPSAGETSLFIYSGYDFKVVDGMLTNFHLPRTSLFMLVCALAGRERMLEAYQIAMAERYRFYSYGDAMLIL
jgi:S-adenosylmethionine:tRNA ribosyltransferase-isomerase